VRSNNALVVGGLPVYAQKLVVTGLDFFAARRVLAGACAVVAGLVCAHDRKDFHPSDGKEARMALQIRASHVGNYFYTLISR